MQTSKIVDVMFDKTWNDLKIYKLKVANGQSGSIFTKTWEPQVGEELTYTYDVEKTRFKRVNPNANYGGGQGYQAKPSGGASKDKLIVRQVALKCAVEFSNGQDYKVKQVLQVADLFNDWVNQKEEPVQSVSSVRESVVEKEDDLPF